VSLAAAITAKTVTRIVFVTYLGRAVSRLTWIVSLVKHVTAVLTSSLPDGIRQRTVYSLQQ
jgi:hypothetical protein